MATTELSRSKSICILAIVVCCFAILWPKIFLPMLQSALSLSSSKNDDSYTSNSCGCDQKDSTPLICGTEFDEGKLLSHLHTILLDFRQNEACKQDIMDLCGIDLYEGIDYEKPLIVVYPIIESKIKSISRCLKKNFKNEAHSPSMLPPRVREAMKLSRPEEFRREPGRPFPRDRINMNQQTKQTGGVMGLVMPLYTIGIVIFFLYTMFKMVFKKRSEDETIDEEEKPKVQDFQMDPEYRKFILSDEYDENGVRIKTMANSRRKEYLKSEMDKKDKNIQKTKKVVEEYGRDKVSKALNTLIRDMEKFKTKLIEVESCRNKITQIESAKLAAQVCLDKAKRELNEAKGELSESNEEINEQEESKLDDEDNSDVCHQNADESDPEDKSISKVDENEVDDENEKFDLDYSYEQNLKEKLMNTLDPNVWDKVKREMQELHNLKEE